MKTTVRQTSFTFFFIILCVLFFATGAANAAKPMFKPGELVVKGDAREFTDYEVVKHLPNSGYTVLKVTPGKEMAQIRKLRDKGRKVSLNFVVRKFATADDTYFPYQWNMSAVQAEQAWDITTGSGVKVAVLDTGLSSGGPDGIDCVVAGKNIIDGSNNVADGDGHGTHVSGTIAQRTNNAAGVAGLAHGACIMPVKVLDDSGSGTDADVAEGIAWAIANGARVLNMSLGYPAQYSLSDFAGSASYNALDAANDNVTIAVASGNDGATGGVSYPASHPNTLSVGATGFDNAIAPYSNQGDDLDIVAPGGNTGVDLNGDGYGDGILQETRLLSDGSMKWGYYFFQGTSMATPHVAAAAALLISANTSLNRADVLSKLQSSAIDLGAAGPDPVFGHGLIQTADSLVGLSVPSNESPVASFTVDCVASFLCSFASTSTDDGSIDNHQWGFGDGSALVNTATASVDHQYTAPGDYTVSLTVTDNEGAVSSASQLITLVGAPPTEIPSIYSVTDNADSTATIDWDYSDSTATEFHIERRKYNSRKDRWSGASLIATVPSNVLSYTDSSGKGTFGYRVRASNADGATDWSGWSEDVTVTGGKKGGGGKGGGKPVK
ncbi:MAG: S8 family serine peptidase [Cycloclasticus sp.]